MRVLTTLILVGTSVAIQADRSISATSRSVNPVVQWNRNLLSIVRTPGAQPRTLHPTRSFAILHAAIYDAVNAIDQTHTPYRVTVSSVSPGFTGRGGRCGRTRSSRDTVPDIQADSRR